MQCVGVISFLWFVVGSSVNGEEQERDGYILYLPNCKIPEVPIDNDAIGPEWNVTFNELQCKQEPDLSTLSEDGELVLTEIGKSSSDCCFTEIMRPQELVNDTYILSHCAPFPETGKMSIPDKEFGFVSCKSTDKPQNSNPKMKFHSQIKIKPKVQAKLNYWKKVKDEDKPISIVILILDSISRTHAFRGIPKTMQLMEEMKFVDFRGHHVLGEPTFENEVPLLMGTTSKDLPHKLPHFAGKFDKYPFIWKNFSEAGYVTMDNEDFPLYHTFNFNGRTGFTHQPFDYYMRPYYMAQENLNRKFSKQAMPIYHFNSKTKKVSSSFASFLTCTESQLVYDFLFGYTWKFLNVISPKLAPSFSISFLGWPQHDYLTLIKWLDDPLLKLMTNIQKTPDIYDNAAIILMGDHGFRRANYSQEGLLERDLPLFSMRLPERFTKKYPELVKNFKQNSRRVTSHLDIFKTLVHLHKLGLPDDDPKKENGSYGYNRPYGISLFENIGKDRTCEDAQIPVPKHCACNFPLHADKFDYNIYRKDAE